SGFPQDIADALHIPREPDEYLRPEDALREMLAIEDLTAQEASYYYQFRNGHPQGSNYPSRFILDLNGIQIRHFIETEIYMFITTQYLASVYDIEEPRKGSFIQRVTERYEYFKPLAEGMDTVVALTIPGQLQAKNWLRTEDYQRIATEGTVKFF